MTIGVVHRPKPGNPICGDAWLAIERPTRTLVCVCDGLGSGSAARHASEQALTTVNAKADLPLAEILNECNGALQGTRGAAVGLLGIYAGERRVDYAGVGNIEVRTRREWGFGPLSLRGIVGSTNYRVPRVYDAAYEPGEWLLLHSDGLRSRFDLSMEMLRAGAQANSPQGLADHLAACYGREGDDLTLLVLQLP